MKTRTRFLLLVLCIGFTACSKDDEPKEQPVVDAFGRRLVSQLESTSGDENFTLNFFYDKYGKIEKIVGDNPAVLKEAIYNYTENKLVIQSDYEEEGSEMYTFMLNNEENVISYSNTVNYEYQNGFLRKATYRNSLSPESLTWSNGDIIELRSGTQVATFTYYRQENKMNFDPFDVGEAVEGLAFGDDVYCLTTGCFGNRNAHLIRKIQSADWATEFSYDFDSEGYVTRIVQIESNDPIMTPLITVTKVTYTK